MAYYLVTGGTGLIGQALITELLSNDNQVTVLTRDKNKVRDLWKDHLKNNTVTPVSKLEEISSDSRVDYVVNLAGEPIADKRWSSAQKQRIWQSRVDLTQSLVDWMKQLQTLPKVLVSGSAVGWYGDGGDEILSERSEASDEFTHQLCDAWEKVAHDIAKSGVRVCTIRTGLVIAAHGGFLAKMKLPFQFGLGARLGNGKQYMPWIHIDDMVRAILFLLAGEKERNPLSGSFNLTSPNPVTNSEFTRLLAAQLNRPSFLVAPAPVLKLMLGEMSRLLLTGQRAIPERLTEAGFEFRFSLLDKALEDVL